MVSWEFDPFFTRGGVAYAVRRLADQLTGLGIETRVLMPGWVDTPPANGLSPLLKTISLKMPAGISSATRAVQCSEFCRAAVTAFDEMSDSSESDAVIAHGDGGAMFIVMRNGMRSRVPSVFWLHGLYDPPISDFTKEQRRLLPSQSLLASVVMMADVVVTSMGILKDAREFEWPDGLKELQKALTTASAENRVLTVESMGCLPEVWKNSENKLNPSSNLENLKNLSSPYVLFPSRPTITKGFGIFMSIAERLQAENIACVAVGAPAPDPRLENPSRNTFVHWLPWLPQEEFPVALHNATCTVLPSISEGFGLTAAESITLGVPTLYHQVGGHHGLQERPNGLPITLTTSERAHLYRLMSELSATYSWAVWTRHEKSLQSVIDKCIEAVRSMTYRGKVPFAPTENPYIASQPIEQEQWGNKLLHRIRSGSSLEFKL
jgi:hypothetical protein